VWGSGGQEQKPTWSNKQGANSKIAEATSLVERLKANRKAKDESTYDLMQFLK
jgi:hypothetical protein